MITIDSTIRASAAMNAIFEAVPALDFRNGMELFRVKSDGAQVFVIPLTDISNEQEQAIRDAVAGVGAWALTNDASAVDSPVTITGMDAAYDYTVTLDGETVASGSDTAAPFELTLTPPVAGEYTITCAEQGGYKTGTLTIEVT